MMLKSNIKRIFFTLFTLLFLQVFSQVASAAIITIKSVEGLKKHIINHKYTDFDMMVFGVDMVLTMPHNPVFQMPTLKMYRNEFRRFLTTITRKERDIAFLYMMLESPQIPTSEAMKELVKEQKKQGVKIIALTSLLSGNFKQMSNASEWRGLSLMLAGYDFTNTPPEGVTYKKNFIKYLGSYPKRADHLLITNGEYGGVTKGALLVHYLKEKFVIPKRLVMIDGRLKNIKTVALELKKHFPGVKFIGIHYVAAAHAEVKNITRKQFKKALRKIYKFVQANKNIS